MTTSSEIGRRAARAAGWVALVCLGVELLYVPFASWLLPSAFAALARRHDLELQVVHFRSWYPGNVRANGLTLSGRDPALTFSSQAIRGRIELSSFLSGTLAFAFLNVSRVDVSLARAQPKLARASQLEPSYSKIQTAGALGIADLERLRLETAEFDVRSLQLGALRLAGRLVLHLENTSVAPRAGRLDASATLRGVSAGMPVERAGAALSELRGKLDFAFARSPSQTSAPSSWSGTTHGDLSWKAASLSALFESAPDLVARDAQLRFELRSVGAAAVAGSFGELHARELQTPPLRLDGCGVLWRDATVRVDVGKSSPADVTRGSLSAQSPSTDLFCSAAGAFEVDAEAPFRILEQSQTSITFDSGTIHARRLGQQGVPSRPSSALSASLSLSRASWSHSAGFELGGTLTAQGADAGALLTLAHADPGARWMLNEVVGQPFTAQLQASLTSARLALEHVEIATDGVTADGAVAIADGGARGAFLVERGRLNLGVQVTKDGLQLRLAPPRVWLRQSLRPLALTP